MKYLTYEFSKRTIYVDALAVCDNMVDQDLIEDYDLKFYEDIDILVATIYIKDSISENNIFRLGGAMALKESNQTSMIRKFNESRRNQS